MIMIVSFCLLLNVAVFLLVNCSLFDDPPPPPTPRPRQRVVVQQPRSEPPKRKERSEKKIKYDTRPKTTDPKMKPRECNDNETVDETPSQWGDFDATFEKGHKKRSSSKPSR